MTKKFHILLVIFMLGFLTKPTLTFACGTNSGKTEKSCCKKDKTHKTKKKDCCKTHESKKGKDSKDCDGNCKHSSCNCQVVHYAFISTFPTQLNLELYLEISEKTNQLYTENLLLDGFCSIWTPPNIG